ncbi:MAG: DNA/RNA helicase, partial [Pseudomonadota bacterium]
MPEAGAVAFGFSGSDFLTAVAGVNGVRKFGRDFVLSSIPMTKARKVLEASIFRAIVPSKLDRAKMDRIAARRSEAKDLAELL